MNKLIFLLLITTLSFSANGQSKNKKTSFVVKGNCTMCKARIERAALSVKGVKFADWDIQIKQLSLVLDEFKCSKKEVKKAIVDIGHDTDSILASNKTYVKLPPCCKYRDPKSLMLNHNRRR